MIDPDAPELNDLAAAIRAAIEKEEKALRTREEIRDALGRATKRLAKRDFAGALALVDEVLARDPQHADALELRAGVRSPAATCPSRRPRALVYSRRWSWAVATGGLILAAAVGFVVYQQVSKPGPQSGTGVQPPASQAAPPKPTFRSRRRIPSVRRTRIPRSDACARTVA